MDFKFNNYILSIIVTGLIFILIPSTTYAREISNINESVNPSEILFVVDSMTGQDAVNTAKAFHDVLNFDGVVLTKLDGDTRGGAAISIKSVVNKPIKFINPEILEFSEAMSEFEEGCLSIPSVRGGVLRKSKIHITYFDEEWNKKNKEFDGMRARVIQHEFDHINGKLFVDYLPSLKRKLLKNKLSEILRGKVDVNYNVKK